MEYNTQRESMPIPEYGRNIQNMIAYASTLKDRETRNKAAHLIVAMMGQMNPSLRDSEDFRHKLWDHLFIISKFSLDVDSPYPIPNAEGLKAKPKKVSYPGHRIKYKHYGKFMEPVIQAISSLEPGEQRDALVERIANFMKMNFLQWNRDSVTDDQILEQLREISGGKLSLHENAKLHLTADILAKTTKKFPENKKGKNQKFRRDHRRRGK